MMRTLIRVILIALGALALLVALAAGAFLLANRTNGTLVSSGEKRAYLLYVPDSYDPTVPAPLVVSFHGFAEWPAHQMRISGWNELADRYGFIVVYPSGTGFPLGWRTHGTAGPTPPIDVLFVSDLIDELEARFNIDATRIYANGLSNGGGMAFVLSCALSERIAAIGGVSGAYLLPWELCTPSRPVPTIVFHGTDDPIVPYQGGPSRSFNIAFPAIPAWVAMLAERNGCHETPVELPRMGEATGVAYSDCSASVAFYTIAGGGHAWPGGEPLPEMIVGHTTQDLNATQLMWDFFQAHRLTDD